MTATDADLNALLDLVRSATGPDREIDLALLHLWQPDHDALRTYDASYSVEIRDGVFSVWKRDGGYSASIPFPRLTASIDAALALTERLLPGWVVDDLSQNSRLAGDPWGCQLGLYHGADPSKNMQALSGHDFSDAPLAILAATLQALIARAQP